VFALERSRVTCISGNRGVGRRQTLLDLSTKIQVEQAETFYQCTELTVAHCQAFRRHRRQQKIADTTINRDLSKVRKAFKIGIQLGKIHAMPAGGCDFHKRPERENTRRVRLPDRYYSFFRDVLHPALRCLFVVAYNIGRRLSELLNLRWDRVDFEEQCIYFESTKFGAGKAPFIGEMESWIRRQREMRDLDVSGLPLRILLVQLPGR
jgi:integrase